MFGKRVRSTIELRYSDEVRDLNISFDLIDKIRAKVPWEKLAMDLAKDDPEPNFTMLAKFIFYNLQAAGFKPDIDDIYDEIMEGADNQASYIQVASQIVMAYQPRGSAKKKALVEKPVKKTTAKKAT